MTCNGEAPSVEEARQAFQGKVDVIGVTWAGDTKTYQDFVTRHRLSFPQAVDEGGALFAHFGVPGQPAWVFVGRDGKVERHLGALEPDEIADKLTALSA